MRFFHLIASLGLAGLSTAEQFLYYNDGSQVRTNDSSKPVKFNKVAIGTTELDASDTSSLHNITQGHHFGHRGWYLSTSSGDPMWEYLDVTKTRSRDVKANKRKESSTKRQSDGEEFFSFLDLTPSEGSVDDLVDFQMEEAIEYTFQEQFGFFSVDEVDWEASYSFTMDLFANGDYVTGSTALSATLEGFFATAWELFAL